MGCYGSSSWVLGERDSITFIAIDINYENQGMDGEILHDYFAIREGGGRLVLTLASNWDWPVTGGFVSRRVPFDQEWPTVTFRELGVRPGLRPLQAVNLTRSWRHYQSSAQTIIYSGTYAPMAVVNQPHSHNILYCHSPPRYIYDQRKFYLAFTPLWQQPVWLSLSRYIKLRYEKAVAQMDCIVVNSETVRRRVNQYLGRTSIVVPPPCDIERYVWHKAEGYYLSMARLDPLKRVDVVVRAFREMPDKKLLVVSTGSEQRRLERLGNGASNIHFLGEVGDDYLRKLIGECIATVYIPRDEDFGISPVESMAAGKPVIGVAEGGLRETIVDQETGILLSPDPSVEELSEAVRWLTADRAYDMRGACENRAQLFRTEVFLDRMRAVVESQ